MFRRDFLRFHNERLVVILTELGESYKVSGDTFRASAYANAARTIQGVPFTIKSSSQVAGMAGIGASILSKVDEVVKTGSLQKHKQLEKDPKHKALLLFTRVHGIGPVLARKLVYEKGFRKLSDLSNQKDIELHPHQKLGVKHLEDSEVPIPRVEVTSHLDRITKGIQGSLLGSKTVVVGCGSYRRGRATCGDVDVMIATPGDPSDTLKKATDALRDSKVILSTLAEGKTKFMGYVQGPQYARRFDMRWVKYESLPTALLYFTGSKTFNTEMRAYALTKGFTLNEYGLYPIKNRGKKEKVGAVKVKSEKDIFKTIGMTFVEPKDRN